MNSLVFVLAAIFMVTYAANHCKTVSPCVFKTRAGTFDLTAFNGTVPVPTTDGEFQFNPCTGFTCGNDSSLVCHAKQNLTLINESVKPNCTAVNDTISLHYKQAKVHVTVMMKCSSMNTTFEYDAKKSKKDTYIFKLASQQGCAIVATTVIPANVTTMPTNMTTMPTNMTTMPSNMTTMPSNMTTMPSNMTTMPSNMTTMPSNMTTMPSNMTTHHMTTVPSNMTTVVTGTTPTTITTTDGATTAVTSFTLVLSMASAVYLVSHAMQD